MKKAILATLLGLFLSGCSFEDVFSKLATSDVERAAGEVMERQQEKQHKLEVIEAKKSSFSQFVVLAAENEDAPYQAIAFRNNYAADDKSLVEIEAIVPDPGEREYGVWIKSSEDKTFDKIGLLKYQNVDDYNFIYETDEDLSLSNQIVISLDEMGVEQPVQIVLAGAFTSQ